MSHRNELTEIFSGILFVTTMHAMAIVLILWTVVFIISVSTPTINSSRWSPLIIFPSFYIGIFQLLYVIPVTIVLKVREQFGLMKGVIIGAVITALLNGGCLLYILSTAG